MKKVLIPTKLDKFAANLLRQKGYIVTLDDSTPLIDLARDNSDTEVMIVRSEKITAEIIDLMPKLRLIVRAGAGYNTIDTKYARRKNIDVMNTPGANANAVAEEVIAMVLAAFRHVVSGDATMREGKWEKKSMLGSELSGKTIGVIGLGNIGRLLVKRLSGFEMRVLGYDPMIPESYAGKLGIEMCEVEKIFAEADIISLHVPEIPETKNMVNAERLQLMKPGAVLVNCARAGIINEDDLRSAKAEKNIVFCNDVYQKDEPGMKSVVDIADIMLPHLGANTKEANFNAAKMAADQTIAYFEQGITNCVVNKEIPDGLDEKFQKLAFVLSGIAKSALGKNVVPERIETSFYGELSQYAKWMLAPVTAGICGDFDPHTDAADAKSFLASRGIEFINRETDESKQYGNSMTIDVCCLGTKPACVSLRGTIAENNMMVSRIANYDKLYLEPSGYNLFIEYDDAPGVLGKITGLLGEKHINIMDIRAPQDLKNNRSLAVIKTNMEVPNILIEKIKENAKAINVFKFTWTE
ncbi:MAG: 3-phosphoglycerate dehydrogenase family protein [Victivallaceae bacterium]|nr:3-phosphoglycerate dehydrogenase family protein [Victivallaceae bacterium]MDD4182075.1 3-phosphoglycerate dehydrogenase family protein [Victivallaceae bacterium]